MGIMYLVYSHLPLLELINKISLLSKKDRRMVCSQSELLSQERCLRISICPTVAINYTQLKFSMQVATSFEIYVEKMQEIEVMPLEMLLHKITKQNKQLEKVGKTQKKVRRIVLGLNYKINTSLLSSVLKKQPEMFQDLLIKIIVPTSSEMMPKLFQSMQFVRNMSIDLNNKTIDFYEFPTQSVANIKQLAFKKHSFNFEKLVELFEQIEELTISAEEFNNTKQSFVRQRKLQKVNITCNYSELKLAAKNPELYNE